MIRAHLCALGLCLQTQERGPEEKSSVNLDPQGLAMERQSPQEGTVDRAAWSLGSRASLPLRFVTTPTAMTNSLNLSGRAENQWLLVWVWGLHQGSHTILAHWLPLGACTCAPGLGSTPQLTTCLT